MAACSELELDGKSSHEKRLLCSKSLDSTNVKEDAFNTQKACKSEMSETTITVEDSKNTVDIGSLTEEQLQSLLEEATTFNRPQDEASSILRALRKQIKDSDDVKEATPDSSSNSASGVPPAGVVPGLVAHSSISSKRKNRNSGSVSSHRGCLLLADDDTLMVDYSSLIQQQSYKNSEAGLGSGGGAGRHCTVNFGRETTRELQSQSLQDLASARFTETHDSMRAAGIGRGNRRLQKAGRANSFTEHSSEWTGLGAQISTLDRTQGRSLKSSKPRVSASSRAAWTGQIVVNATDAENGNPVGVSPSAVKLPNEPYALFNDCEYDMSSGESFSSKVWSTRSSDSSSPDKEHSQLDTIPISSCDTSDSGVSLLSCRPLNEDFCPTVGSSEYGSLEQLKRRASPNEIEMIDMSKTASFGEVGECGSMFVCNRLQDGYADVDAPVVFPLKTGSSGHNNINCPTRSGPVNGIYELPEHYRSVQSIISPADDMRKGCWGNSVVYPEMKRSSKHHVLCCEDFKIVDMRSMPFFNHLTPSAGNYSLDGPQAKNELTNAGMHGLKKRRTKSNAETKKAEDCVGYRGKEDIDTLLEFINSTDKIKNQGHGTTTTIAASVNINSNSNTNNNNNNNNNNNTSNSATITSSIGNIKCKGNGSVLVAQTVASKSVVNSFDNERKSNPIIKEKCSKSFKKKIGSLENPDEEFGDVPQQNNNNNNANLESDSDHGDEHSPIDTVVSGGIREGPSNVFGRKSENVCTLKTLDKKCVSDSIDPLLSFPSKSLVSSFAKDFYSVTEVNTQLIEESEFRVVVNKQRKRKQTKKQDGFRRYGNTCSTVPPGVGSGGSSERDYYLQESPCHSMLLSGLPLSHRTQRGQSEFSRRKSTSSMPPSEPSSADNSDLDSVHSLPVSGTAPPPTRPHPHTTPSSMSSTPQASYADIARMSTQTSAQAASRSRGHELTPTSSSVQNSASVSPNPLPSPTTVSAAVQTSTQDLLEAFESTCNVSHEKETEGADQEDKSAFCKTEYENVQSASTTFPENLSLVSSADAPKLSTQGPVSSGPCERTSSSPLPPVSDEKCAVSLGSVVQEVPDNSVKMDWPGPAALPSQTSSIAVTKMSPSGNARLGNPTSNTVKRNSPPAPTQPCISTASLDSKYNNPSIVLASKPSTTVALVPSNASTAFAPTNTNNMPPPVSKQNAPVTPFAKNTLNVPGPRFLQESTVLCQSQNLTVKPSSHNIEPTTSGNAVELPVVSRTKSSSVYTEGAVRKAVLPVIKSDKVSLHSGDTSPPQPPPPSCLSDISFGVDMKEIMQLGNDEGQNNPVMFEFEQCSHHPQSENSSNKAVLCAEARPRSGQHTVLTLTSHGNVEACAAAVSACGGIGNESSLEDRESGGVVLVRGKRLQWKENDAEIRNFNHSQVVSFFGTAWDSVLHDFEKDTTQEGKKSGKVCYYSSYC